MKRKAATKVPRFAQGTSVSVAKSRTEIEALVTRHGADQFMAAGDARRAIIVFRAHELLIQFVLALPDPRNAEFTCHPRNRYRLRPKHLAEKAYQAELRRLWRALALVIKAKLEAATSGIESFESAFLANIVTDTGETVGETMLPRIARIRGVVSMPQLPAGETQS